MKNSKEEKLYLLTSFLDNGLVLDIEKSDALSFLSLYQDDDINQYIAHYGVESASGELVFAPDTTFSALRRDILFDKELQNLVIASVSVLHIDVERKIRAYGESRGRKRYNSSLSRKTLEDVWFEFNTSYPVGLREYLSASYGLSVTTFSGELELISYAYERSREGRKLIDHTFIDFPEEETGFMKANMISSVLLMNENLLNYSMHPIRGTSFSDLLSLLDTYSMAGRRVGLTER